MDSSQQISLIIFLAVLIAFSAMFSASETAFSSLNQIRLKQMAKSGDKKAIRAYRISKNFTETITTILVGNNIVNILATSIATSLATAIFAEAGVAIATFVMTVLILIFGEIFPKIIAKTYPENISLFFARPIAILSFILKPLTSLISNIQKSWEKRLDVNRVTTTEDELLEILSTIEQEGVLEQEEREIIESVIEFDDKSVKEVMVNKEDVYFLYDDADFEDLKALMKDHKFSRIPIIDSETLDVVGIIRIRDIFDTMLEGKEVILSELMQKPVFVPQRRKLPAVLEDIQRSREHMGIVVESLKSKRFVGIVTLEDLLEELVGEIYDEYDNIPKNVVEIGHHTFKVEGSVSVFDFFNNFVEEQDFPPTKAKTIADWVTELNEGKKVRKGRTVCYENVCITVLSSEQGKAKTVEIEIGSVVEEEEEL